MKQKNFLDDLQESLIPLREQILSHPLYLKIQTIDDVRIFMQHHVFAVWDFMSLLTALRRGLTCVELPWIPVGNPETRRLINEIVLEEESDIGPQEKYTSHLELYLLGMKECKADTSKIESFIARLAARIPFELAIVESEIPDTASLFIKNTWKIASTGSLHQIAAAFTLGREKVIPDMFYKIVSDICIKFPEQLNIFQDYLNRHIELDKERHSPMGLQMLQSLCGDDISKWKEARETAEIALKSRILLWDGITHSLEASKARNAL